MAEDELSRAAGRRHAAVHAGAAAEGPLHVQPLEGAARADYELPVPEAQDRNWALANGDRPHTLQMAFVYQLPWRSESGGGIARMLINDWQLNGIFGAFSGSPFTVTADGTTLNTPGNLQTADLVGPVTKIGEIGAAGYYYDPTRGRSPTACGSATRGRISSAARAAGTSTCRCSDRSALTGDHRIEAPREASNVTNTPKFGNPTSSVTSGDFMRILSSV